LYSIDVVVVVFIIIIIFFFTFFCACFNVNVSKINKYNVEEKVNRK